MESFFKLKTHREVFICAAYFTCISSDILCNGFFKSDMQSASPFLPIQLGIAIVIAFTAVMGLLRDYVNEDLNMQNPLNKEKNS